ncbi:hypothetical protein ES705_49018 [subsurface metagenome]
MSIIVSVQAGDGSAVSGEVKFSDGSSVYIELSGECEKLNEFALGLSLYTHNE